MSALKTLLAAAALALLGTSAAQAQLRITEVAPWSSGNSPVAADWFEVTNFGSTAVTLSGWKMDDSSNSFAAAVALTGVTSIAPGESVIFLETSSAATTIATFKSTWFGASAPATLQIGSYSGSGVGLGTGGDAVNLYDGAGTLQANVVFGTSPTGPFRSFDNAAGLNQVTLSTLAAAGVNGAFVAAGDTAEIGSPGLISAVPEADSHAMLLAGLAVLGGLMRRRAQR